MSKYTKNLNNTKVNYPIRFNLPNNTKSPVFYSAQEAQQWFNTNYGDKYSIQMPIYLLMLLRIQVLPKMQLLSP